MIVLVETTKSLSSFSAEIFADGAVQLLINNPNKIGNRERGIGNREQKEFHLFTLLYTNDNIFVQLYIRSE